VAGCAQSPGWSIINRTRGLHRVLSPSPRRDRDLYHPTCAWPGFSTDIQLNGTRGGIWIDGGKLLKWKLMDDPQGEEARMLARYGDDVFAAVSDSRGVIGHDYQVWDMADAVLNDRDPMITPVEAMKSLKIILAMYRSVKPALKSG
jgi:predicted dehydrogenase